MYRFQTTAYKISLICHHKSRMQAQRFYLRTSPKLKWACILGRSCYIIVFNPFGFPAPAVIERCTARNIPMYRTDTNGAFKPYQTGGNGQ